MARNTGKELTTLSELKYGVLYTLESEEAKLTLRVVKEGIAPLCIIQGRIEEKFNSETEGLAVVSLLGWAPLLDSEGSNDVQLYVPNEMPKKGAWLIALKNSEAPEPFLLALCPVIKEHP